MGQFGIRYSTLVGAVMAVFAGFVACGSQMYKAALTGDTGTTSTANSNEDGSLMVSAANNTDPSSPTFALNAPQGWGGALPIHFQADYRMNPSQLQGLVKAMHTWETAVGRSLFAYDGPTNHITGDSYPDLYSSLANNINEHLLDDNWGKTGKSSLVLATTIWDNDPSDVQIIVKSDMRFNNQYYDFGDAMTLQSPDARTVVDIQTLATHELGHMLGLAHVPPTVDSSSIMVPSIYIGEGLTSRQLSRGDIERIQKVYGCQGTACDIDATLQAINQQVAEPTATSTSTAGTPQ